MLECPLRSAQGRRRLLHFHPPNAPSAEFDHDHHNCVAVVWLLVVVVVVVDDDDDHPTKASVVTGLFLVFLLLFSSTTCYEKHHCRQASRPSSSLSWWPPSPPSPRHEKIGAHTPTVTKQFFAVRFRFPCHPEGPDRCAFGTNNGPVQCGNQVPVRHERPIPQDRIPSDGECGS